MIKDIVIRAYRKEDRNPVREIAWKTAFMGESADIFFTDKKIVGDFLTSYFTDYEPQSCFVAESNGKVVGYIFGSQDVARFNRKFLLKIFPKILLKFFYRLSFLKRKNFLFIFRFLRSILKKEFLMPSFIKAYPANLHINIEKEFRNLGIGKVLLDSYLKHLQNNKVSGVHLATLSERAKKFFEREGFKLLYEGKRSYFRHILGRDIPVYIYGKRL
ncbi:MAG: GNAT family N-acetyltransferase [Candidatus Omnitrophota bacterium]